MWVTESDKGMRGNPDIDWGFSNIHHRLQYPESGRHANNALALANLWQSSFSSSLAVIFWMFVYMHVYRFKWDRTPWLVCIKCFADKYEWMFHMCKCVLKYMCTSICMHPCGEWGHTAVPKGPQWSHTQTYATHVGTSGHLWDPGSSKPPETSHGWPPALTDSSSCDPLAHHCRLFTVLSVVGDVCGCFRVTMAIRCWMQLTIFIAALLLNAVSILLENNFESRKWGTIIKLQAVWAWHKQAC